MTDRASQFTDQKNPSLKQNQTNQDILFFDGHCNLCNSFIDFLVRHNRRGELKVASLQGKTAKDLIPAFHRQDSDELSTVVFLYRGKILNKSEAAICAIASCRPLFKGIKLLLVIPKSLRDFLYDIIAKNRLAWFGRQPTCRLPTQAEAQTFLP